MLLVDQLPKPTEVSEEGLRVYLNLTNIGPTWEEQLHNVVSKVVLWQWFHRLLPVKVVVKQYHEYHHNKTQESSMDRSMEDGPLDSNTRQSVAVQRVEASRLKKNTFANS